MLRAKGTIAILAGKINNAKRNPLISGFFYGFSICVSFGLVFRWRLWLFLAAGRAVF